MPDCDRLLTRREVEARTRLSRSSLYRKMREQPPSFPLPLKISTRAVRWSSDEVEAWLSGRPRASGEGVDRPAA